VYPGLPEVRAVEVFLALVAEQLLDVPLMKVGAKSSLALKL
jgi:hypothetical protein